MVLALGLYPTALSHMVLALGLYPTAPQSHGPGTRPVPHRPSVTWSWHSARTPPPLSHMVLALGLYPTAPQSHGPGTRPVPHRPSVTWSWHSAYPTALSVGPDLSLIESAAVSDLQLAGTNIKHTNNN
ncbi:hypothetical protein NHX12_026923 [Muraenolepis orangiensis]|uniref:NADH dehydrogenase subunit 4 n=1 Tax=Muraenolepis orangiensis TaxID=630683 RepID=A0A9Q0IQ01_9TELE|nr:hypothetical protein NHX12_026923 [Muraenolepis orangiensis]